VGLVFGDAVQGAAVWQFYLHRTIARHLERLGIAEGKRDLRQCPLMPQVRQIRPEHSATAVNSVAAQASSLSLEEELSLRWVSGRRMIGRWRAQGGNEGYQRIHFRCRQREGRHTA